MHRNITVRRALSNCSARATSDRLLFSQHQLGSVAEFSHVVLVRARRLFNKERRVRTARAPVCRIGAISLFSH